MYRKRIEEIVHYEYYEHDTNCATVSMMCLSELFGISLSDDMIAAATGMHGAGGYRAQCGLVEGPLMFIGLYGRKKGKSRDEIVTFCYGFGQAFEKKFGSLRCRELRPGGFQADDPPHMCESLTVRAIKFACEYISQWEN